MEVEYLAGANLLIAAYLVKVAVSPNSRLTKVAGPIVFAFILINAIALGNGLAA